MAITRWVRGFEIESGEMCSEIAVPASWTAQQLHDLVKAPAKDKDVTDAYVLTEPQVKALTTGLDEEFSFEDCEYVLEADEK